MLNAKNWLLALLLLVGTHGLAYWYGYNKPQNVITEVKEVIKRDVKTRIVEVVKPDGSKQTVTNIIDKSKEGRNKRISTSASRADWLVGAYYKVNEPAYAISLSRRVLGPVYLSAFADTTKAFYFGLAVEF